MGTNRVNGARYRPYGDEITTTADDHEKFGTYERSSYTKLDYADQRDYVSGYGRFTTADPYGGSARPWHPGSWNRYVYALGDPVNRSDPRGLCAAVNEGGVYSYMDDNAFMALMYAGVLNFGEVESLDYQDCPLPDAVSVSDTADPVPCVDTDNHFVNCVAAPPTEEPSVNPDFIPIMCGYLCNFSMGFEVSINVTDDTSHTGGQLGLELDSSNGLSVNTSGGVALSSRWGEVGTSLGSDGHVSTSIPLPHRLFSPLRTPVGISYESCGKVGTTVGIGSVPIPGDLLRFSLPIVIWKSSDFHTNEPALAIPPEPPVAIAPLLHGGAELARARPAGRGSS